MYGDSDCRVRIITIDYVNLLIIINSQDYRYRTMNRCINCYHTDESHMDVVANIALVVESEKSVILGHSSRVPNTKIVSLSRESLGTVDYTAPVYLFVTGIFDLDTHSSLLLIKVTVTTFFCD